MYGNNGVYAYFNFTSIVYTILKINFQIYGINIPFTNVVLILIYSTLVSLVVGLLPVAFTIEKKNNANELLNKHYEKYKMKCEKRNKSPLDWNDHLKKKYKNNSLFIIVFSLYLIIFLIIEFLIARGMLIKGNIDVIGIIILIVISFLFVVIISIIRLEVIENKKIKNGTIRKE